MVHKHRQRGEEGAAAPLQPQEAEEIWLVTKKHTNFYRCTIESIMSGCVIKTKEMIVDYRKRRTEHTPIHIDGTVVERVVSFKCLGIHITDKLNWSPTQTAL